MRRVFRDFTALLVANHLSLSQYREMLEPLGFAQIEATDKDKQALGQIKEKKPTLVIATKTLSVFTGPQLLAASRKDEATRSIPFLIIGDKADMKPGGLADKVNTQERAKMIGAPIKQEQFSQAVDELLDPLIDPQLEDAYRLLEEAEEKTKQKNLAEAADLYSQSLALSDQNQGAWLELGNILTKLDRSDEAEDAFLKCLEINNYSIKAFFGLAELYEHRQDIEQAVSILQQALAIAEIIKSSDKSMSRISFYVGEFELRLKRLTDAKKSFDRAVEMNPDDAELQRDIGDAYAEKGYFAESEQYYQAALKIAPGMAHVFNKLGIAYRRQRKYEKALELYESARQHHPKDENLLFNIARTLYESGQHTRAVETINQALEISPNFKVAKLLLAKINASRKTVDLGMDYE